MVVWYPWRRQAALPTFSALLVRRVRTPPTHNLKPAVRVPAAPAWTLLHDIQVFDIPEDELNVSCGRPLPTARAVGKCYTFAEGLTAWLSAKGTASAAVWPGPTLPRAFLCREPGRRQSGALPSASLCRRPGTRQRILCRWRALAVGKDVLCRWLIPWLLAKNLAVSNDSDSGSDCPWVLLLIICTF